MKSFVPGMLLLLATCTATATGHAAGPYVDARAYPTPAEGWERFRAAEARLVQGFDRICGDTFCEGEYHNLQALRFRCSVAATTGHVGECLWTFTGSTARVDTATGRVTVDAQTWACRTPLADNTPLSRLLETLEQDDALHLALPGTTESIYDGLTDCL